MSWPTGHAGGLCLSAGMGTRVAVPPGELEELTRPREVWVVGQGSILHCLPLRCPLAHPLQCSALKCDILL